MKTRISAGTNVLVVYKKTTYERLVKEGFRKRVQRLLATHDPSVSRLNEAHEHHTQAIVRAKAVLKKLGLSATFKDLSVTSGEGFDFVLTLGGDGTLLWASHIVGPETPMLAINTSPKHSVGYFCAGGPGEMEELLVSAMEGRIKAVELQRMRVDLDGKPLSRRILNDMLFSHQCPGATTRYILQFDGITEEHKSSGIWVGPAAGSTAAQHSAGGRVLPLGSRKLQFVVREPYTGDGRRYDLTKGIVDPGGVLSMRSKMVHGRLYLDGPHREHQVELGQELTIQLSDEPLQLLGLQRRKLT